MNPVEICHLTKRYAGFTLDDVSLTVRPGYVTGFVGANGSGKTTTIKCALGMVRPDAGTAAILPHERLGVVLDTPPYSGEWRVAEVELGLSRFFPRWRPDIFDQHLVRASIDRSKKVKELSRGMGMRLQLAVALAHEPDLLVLDEPTSGLDPLGRSELVDELAEYMTDESHAVWFSTHITSDLESLADYLVVLDAGRVVADGATDELLDGYAVVRGAPDALSSELRTQLLGLRETATGWQGMLPSDQVSALVPVGIAERPTIEDLAICLAKGAHHD